MQKYDEMTKIYPYRGNIITANAVIILSIYSSIFFF